MQTKIHSFIHSTQGSSSQLNSDLLMHLAVRSYYAHRWEVALTGQRIFLVCQADKSCAGV